MSYVAAEPPSARQVSRTVRRAAANRETIINAAVATLAETGVAAFSVEAVAKRADVAIQTVYNRVGGRPALLQAVAMRVLGEARAQMDLAYESPGSPLERIRAVALAYTNFVATRPQQFQLLVLSSGADLASAAISEQAVALTARQNAKLAALIAEGAADGDFYADLDPVTTADALWAMTNGLLNANWHVGASVRTPEQLEQLTAAGIRVLLRGILTHPAEVVA